MSMSLERLRALRRQAGDPTVRQAPAAPSAAASAAAETAQDSGAQPSQSFPAIPNSASQRERQGALSTSDRAGPASAPSLCEARGGLGRGKALDLDLALDPHSTRPVRLRTPSTPAANDTQPPRSLDALRRLIATRERKPGTTPVPARKPASLDRSLPGRELSPGLHLIEAFLPQPIPRAALSLAFAKRHEEAVHPRDLLFFDTETTGLAGGTGTRAFMIGAADWHVDADGGEGLRVRQLMISTMAAEAPMLRAFAGWLSPTTVLSSYNGRCYDAPLLKTRYRLARMAEPLSALDHVDLLFPTRRRYRGTWENCRLATIERQLLRIVRQDDLPGAEAPAAWLSFLRGGSAGNLRRVAEHNRQDVVTLAQLFQRLVQAEADDREVLSFEEAP
ncbi:ribonuclease H-like domain-containing protein [Pseudoxanthomonas winnipegensis]|uniref:ribonuclease H-like domain-containing protein n=1 Tax=Pseudoxanthomonas winnipegensis TaxID=2480810 RepID=UPI003CE45CD5